MSVDSKKREHQPKRSERRTSSRYRLISPPEVEILHAENGAPVKVRLGDLSQGGCSVETDYILPLGAEVTITLSKDRDYVKARARVVRVSPDEGMGLAFTTMEAEGFRLLDSWLSTFVATSWVAANRRRSQRVAMQIEVKVSGYNAEGARFTEYTHTIEISALGGLVILETPVKRGQRLVLSNPKTKVAVECMVAHHENKGAICQVGLAFVVLNQPFWPVEFPPADWSHHHPDAKRFGA
jgi:c-di-GMP-binding flagellar brake protein YcgR